jgi:predicted amidohydrolase
VVGLSPAVRAIKQRADIAVNLDHIERVSRVAFWNASMDIPVRLLTLPEGALQGFPDEVFDLKHADYAARCAIDIPGPETDRLGALCREFDVFLMATAKARHPEFPDRFFNVGFVIDPSGEVILRHHKVSVLQPYEKSLTPHNVWDRWIELYGDGLDAFYPVADTAIGRLGFMMANEAAYPENARGLALNGCEVAYRGPYPSSFYARVQNQARALDNNMYVIANQGGPAVPPDGAASDSLPVDNSWRSSMIVDFKGHVLAEMTHGGGSTFLTGTIDIERLRHFRANAQWGNWLKDLTTEQYALIYRRPIYPKNLDLEDEPPTQAEYRRSVTEETIRGLLADGTWQPSSYDTKTTDEELEGGEHA